MQIIIIASILILTVTLLNPAQVLLNPNSAGSSAAPQTLMAWGNGREMAVVALLLLLRLQRNIDSQHQDLRMATMTPARQGDICC